MNSLVTKYYSNSLTCDILHALESHLALVDLLHGAGLQTVDQSAQQSTVLQHLEEILHVPRGANGFAGDLLDPLQALLRQLIAVFGVNLKRAEVEMRQT